MTQYTLSPVPSLLTRELDTFIAYRTSTFQAKRAGGAVVSLSAESDKKSLLRFFGWMKRADRVPEGAFLDMSLLLRADLADSVQDFVTFLRDRQALRFSSIANYLSGVVSVLSFAYTTHALPEATAALDPSPLTMVINLRGQAEKASKTENLYNKRVGGWLTWEQVQRGRVKAMSNLAECSGDPKERRTLLREAAAISLLSLIPPDRVGVVRKLKLGATLKRTAGGGWAIDLSKYRDKHKTSRFYGPFAAELPIAMRPILTAYAAALEFEFGGSEAYLFHPARGDLNRVMEPSAWSQFIRRLTLKLCGTSVAPKTLRSIFITWLRESTECPEILKSAAHAQKHQLATQESATYDANADTKLVKAAYDFNMAFALKFAAAPVGSGGASSSSSGGGEQRNDSWSLVDAQPKQLMFRRVAPDGDVFACSVPWLAGFEPGLLLRWPTVPGLQGGAQFTVPGAGVGKPLNVRLTVASARGSGSRRRSSASARATRPSS